MLCLNITGAVSSVEIQKTSSDTENVVNTDFVTTQEAVNKLSKTADKYLNLDEKYFTSTVKATSSDFKAPWVSSLKTDLFEWWITVKYDGMEDSEKIVISPDEFKEFLKNPLYMREYYFNVDPDPENDVQIKLGFYTNTILNKQTDSESNGLCTKTIIRTWFPDGTGIDDDDKDLEVWSEIRLNYGLFKTTAKSKPTNIEKPLTSIKDIINNLKTGFFGKIFDKFLQNRQNKMGSRILDFINKIKQRLDKNNDDADITNEENIVTMADDSDWVSIGMGYHSTEGNRVPQVVEKHFSFAKDNIFSPTIFQHEMFPGGTDPYQLEFGFRACTAGTTDPQNAVYDIGFAVQFEPAVYMRTQFIPIGGFVFYHFGQDSQSTKTKITFLADIVKGSGDDLPLFSLTFDRIDSNLGKSGNWISFDLNKNGFEYKANSRFNVGLNLGVPALFDEKVEIKGLPTSVKFDWGVINTDFVIIPKKKFQAGLSVQANLVMDGRIDKILVYYPRVGSYPADAPDARLLEVSGIPASNTFTAGGNINIVNGSMLNVDVSGNIGLSMSSSISGISVYFPKADWYATTDVEFITLPHGVPSRMSASTEVELNVDFKNLMNPSNYFYGMFQHDCSADIQEINVYIPEFEEPLLKLTELPSYAYTYGKLWWGQLKGEVFSQRSSVQNRDPIELNLEFGSFKIYDHLNILDGTMMTSFKIANNGYFYFDTTKHMIGNDLRFNNYETGDQILLSVEDVSADNLQADWDISQANGKLQINSLHFEGILDTLDELELSLTYQGKSTSVDLDWIIGEQGNFEIELSQDNDLTLDFDELFPAGEKYVLNGGITLSKNFGFDMEWKLDLGESAQKPGYFKINKHHDTANIKNFDLYFTIKDSTGKETYGVDIYFLNPRIYLDLQWYIKGLHIYYWLDADFIADYKDVKLLWTDLQGNTDWYEVI